MDVRLVLVYSIVLLFSFRRLEFYLVIILYVSCILVPSSTFNVQSCCHDPRSQLHDHDLDDSIDTSAHYDLPSHYESLMSYSNYDNNNNHTPFVFYNHNFQAFGEPNSSY